MKLHRLIRTMPAWPLLILGATCLLLPLVMLVVVATQTGDGIGIDNFVQVVPNPLDLAVLGHSLPCAAWQMVLCVVLGTPLALALLSKSSRVRAILMSTINVASNFGGPGLAFAFLILIGSNGVLALVWAHLFGATDFPTLGSMVGLNIIMLYVHLPMFLMLSLPSYALLRDEWQEAARMSGAGAWRFWTRVGIPTLAPFVLGNALQVFMWAMGAYSIPYVVTQSPNSVDLVSV